MIINNDVNYIKKTVVSSDILTTAVDLTEPSVGQGLIIEDIIVSTDSTWLAWGTNVQITSDNARWSGIIFQETVANLWANKTVDLDWASITGVRQSLEVGKKLQIKCTGVACTWSWEIDIYIKIAKLDRTSSVL